MLIYPKELVWRCQKAPNNSLPSIRNKERDFGNISACVSQIFSGIRSASQRSYPAASRFSTALSSRRNYVGCRAPRGEFAAIVKISPGRFLFSLCARCRCPSCLKSAMMPVMVLPLWVSDHMRRLRPHLEIPTCVTHSSYMWLHRAPELCVT